MFCPFCGTDNAADQRYCRNCGAVLPTAAKPGRLKSPGGRPGSSTGSHPKATPFVPPQPPELPKPRKTLSVPDNNVAGSSPTGSGMAGPSVGGPAVGGQRAALQKTESTSPKAENPFSTLQAFYLPEAE